MITLTISNQRNEVYIPLKVSEKIKNSDFHLPASFMANYIGKQPDWGPLGYITYKRTYARDIPKIEYSNEDIEKLKKGFSKFIDREITDEMWQQIEDVLYEEGDECFFSIESWSKVKKTLRSFTYFPQHIAKESWNNLRSFVNNIGKPNRTEEYWQTVQRVVEGCFTMQKERCLQKNLEWDENEGLRNAMKMYEKIWNFKFTPPGRGLYTMGTKFVKKRGTTCLNNCAFTSTQNIKNDLSKPFCWTMDALMLGVGVGFDTKGSNQIIIQNPKIVEKVYKIPDSREGWVNALKILLEAFFKGDELPTFDYSKIRPSGEPIRGFGGIASGPEPLKILLNNVKAILSSKIGKKLDATDITDIMTNIGKCVISGNVRRSAEISLGDFDDSEWFNMKKVVFPEDHPRSARWAANISVIAKVGSNYHDIAKAIIEGNNGEPGIVWLDNSRKFSRMISKPDYKDANACGVNPCGEQTLCSMEMCCLCETYPSRHETYEEYEETLKYAYMYAKTVTIGYIKDKRWTETNSIMSANRRIGISQSGIIDAFAKHGRNTILEWCDKGYQYLRKKDKEYSKDWLRVRESIKITSVKPSGTVSLLPGVSAGIHYPHSEYYIRRIRFAYDSPLLEPLAKCGYHIYDDPKSAIYETDGEGKIIYEDTEKLKPKIKKYSTKIVEFPIHEKNFIRGKSQVSMWEQLMNAADYQKWWADNQVSITVTYKKEEEKDIETALQIFDNRLKCVSFLPYRDHTYENAPYEEITKEKYEEMISKIHGELDLKDVYIRAEGEGGCSTDICKAKIEESLLNR